MDEWDTYVFLLAQLRTVVLEAASPPAPRRSLKDDFRRGCAVSVTEITKRNIFAVQRLYMENIVPFSDLSSHPAVIGLLSGIRVTVGATGTAHWRRVGHSTQPLWQ